MARLVTVIDTCCHLSEGLNRLREVCEAMPTQQAWGNRSSSGTTTWPEDDSKRRIVTQGNAAPPCRRRAINSTTLKACMITTITISSLRISIPFCLKFLSYIIVAVEILSLLEWYQCHHQSRRSISQYMLNCVKRRFISPLLIARGACAKGKYSVHEAPPLVLIWVLQNHSYICISPFYFNSNATPRPQFLKLTWHQWLDTILRVGFAQQAHVLLALMRSGDVMRPRDPKRAWWDRNVFHSKVGAWHTLKKKQR